ncbi:putative DNA-directed RNA polymerase [Halotydeus destructor]|nr:putative DNA-directed RNA polymerase [Halotydeus destructor]
MDLLIGCFFISGGFKHIPMYMINNCRSYHMTRTKQVRIFYYTVRGEGFKMDYCKIRKQLSVTDNHGICKQGGAAFDDDRLPAGLSLSAMLHYMDSLSESRLDTDRLENKMVLESGDFLYRIVMREVKPYIKTIIETGCPRPYILNNLKSRVLSGQALVDCLSRKTALNCSSRAGHQLQFGSQGQVFVEKENSMFLPVNLTAFQLSPLIANTCRRVFSEKTKTNRAVAFNASHVAFICPLYTSESKNIGKTVALCRNVRTSFHPEKSISAAAEFVISEFTDNVRVDTKFMMIINQLPYWTNEDRYKRFKESLIQFKNAYGMVEAYFEEQTACKLGFFTILDSILYKKLGTFWVSAAEFQFWTKRLYPAEDMKNVLDKLGFEYVSSYFTLLTPMSKHNCSAKVTLLLNNWRNSILAVDGQIGSSVFEPIFATKTPNQEVDVPYFDPVDEFSARFQVFIPKLRVGFTWALGWNQEDCLAVNKSSLFARKEQVVRFMCPKIICRVEVDWKSLMSAKPKFEFHAMTYSGDPSLHPVVLGLIQETQGLPISCSSYCPGLSFKMLKCNVWQKLSDGDKLCSLNGQKGVVKLIEPFTNPADRNGIDLFLHPASVIKRQTMGELLMFGGAREEMIESNGIAHQIMVAETLFLEINYRSEDNLYVSDSCVIDAVMNQPTKGSNRNGAMKIGPMEIRNCFVGHGIAETAYELLIEKSDIQYQGSERRTTAFELCDADAKFLKCCYETDSADMIELNPVISR